MFTCEGARSGISRGTRFNENALRSALEPVSFPGRKLTSSLHAASVHHDSPTRDVGHRRQPLPRSASVSLCVCNLRSEG